MGVTMGLWFRHRREKKKAGCKAKKQKASSATYSDDPRADGERESRGTDVVVVAAIIAANGWTEQL